MTVRQLFVIVMLVAAAFLGGAFVNGPGLQWAQTKLVRSLNLNNVGEITSIELKPATSPETESKALIDRPVSGNQAQGPVAPVPSVQTEEESLRGDSSGRLTRSQAQPILAVQEATPRAKQAIPSSLKDSAFGSALKNLSSSRSDRRVSPASRAIPLQDTHSPSPSVGEAAPAILDSLAALLPVDPPSALSAVPSSHSSPPKSPSSTAELDEADQWVLLERKMASLGVARYVIEGAPSGPVIFSCLIPLAGRQAVAQRFEGEGDDIIHAAQATLRRISLWRAGQSVLP